MAYLLPALAITTACGRISFDPIVIAIADAEQSTTQITRGVADDAEEFLMDGTVDLGDTDLDLGTGTTGPQLAGLRFVGIDVPPGATIVHAEIQFQSYELSEDASALVIQAQAADDPPAFVAATFDLSTRPTTPSVVTWSPPPWPLGARGPDQVTPNLAPVLQEVIERPGWTPGNAAVFLIQGSGIREAETLEGIPGAAAVLRIEYR